MTPCIKTLEMRKILHKIHNYSHDATSASYGEEAAIKLGIDQNRVFKTLVLATDKNELAVGIVPVSAKISTKSLAKALGAKKCSMAEPKEVEKATGYILGGVSPVGQKKRLRTVIDQSAKDHKSIYVSAGKRGLEVELSPLDLQKLLDAKLADIAT